MAVDALTKSIFEMQVELARLKALDPNYLKHRSGNAGKIAQLNTSIITAQKQLAAQQKSANTVIKKS